MLDIRKRTDLVNSTNSLGGTPLFDACEFGNVENVKILLDHGAFINARTKMNLTPMIYAVTKRHVDIINVLKTYNSFQANLQLKDISNALTKSVFDDNRKTLKNLQN